MNYHYHLPCSSYPSWSRAFICPETPRSGVKQGQTELHLNNLCLFPNRFPNKSEVLTCLVLSVFIRLWHVVIFLGQRWSESHLPFWHSVLPVLVRCETRCPHLQAGVSPQRLNLFKPKAALLRVEQEFGCGARQGGNFEPETTQSPPKYPNLPAVSSSP